MLAMTCTGTVFHRFHWSETVDEQDGQPCGRPATQLVTITGADRAKNLRAEARATPWNLDKAPRCDECARMDQRIAARLFPGSTFDSEPIPAGAVV